MHRSLAAGVAILLMVEPIKPFRVRQTVAGGWQVMSALPFRGARDVDGGALVMSIAAQSRIAFLHV